MIALGLTLAGSLGLAACGDTDDAETTTTTPPVATEPATPPATTEPAPPPATTP